MVTLDKDKIIKAELGNGWTDADVIAYLRALPPAPVEYPVQGRFAKIKAGEITEVTAEEATRLAAVLRQPLSGILQG